MASSDSACVDFSFFFQNLTGIEGLSEAKVDKICEAAEKIVVRIRKKNLTIT